MADGLATATTEAATAWLDCLDPVQRTTAHAAFDSDARHDWHYIPRDRPGLCLADMSAEQQKLALDLLATGLGVDAFGLACLVMALEDPLDRAEVGGGPKRGARRAWGRHRAEYHAAVFGWPGDDAWSWRFEGHHVSITLSVVGGRVVATPSFLGANPAELGAIRLMPREQDLAFGLLDAMPERHRQAAWLSDVAPADILTGNATTTGDLIHRQEGLLLGDVKGTARVLAHDLLACYVTRLPVGSAMHAADLDALRFVFAGEAEPGRPHYYRLAGPDLVIEYDNTQDGANHIHTVVRHPSADFGSDLLRRHVRRHHGT